MVFFFSSLVLVVLRSCLLTVVDRVCRVGSGRYTQAVVAVVARTFLLYFFLFGVFFLHLSLVTAP